MLMMRSRKMAFAAALCLALGAGVLIGQATADQPAMQNALANLQQAKANLRNATSDKGGHRVAAIAHVDAAIAEVRAGMAHDRRN
jgi:hypothetical protein